MPNQAILLLILLTLTASLPALAFSLSEFIEQKDIVIVGETHRRPESIQLISETAAKYLEAGECLIVALEIDSDQQGILERALKGKTPVSSISIFPTIDFPAYREMLSSFQDHVENGRCLRVQAIDAPNDVDADRDEWMTEEIVKLIGDTPILVLIGNIHAIKKVKWSPDSRGKMYLAERLAKEGVNFSSVLQYWTKEKCDSRSGKVVSASDPRALEYATSIMDTLNAEVPEKASDVTDAVIVWSCDKAI